jgi:hypothetical protein
MAEPTGPPCRARILRYNVARDIPRSLATWVAGCPFSIRCAAFSICRSLVEDLISGEDIDAA